MIPCHWEIGRIRPSKNKIIKLTVTPRAISYQPSSNDTPSSPPYHIGIKIKWVPENIYNEELPAGIGDDSNHSPLVIDYDLRMGDMTLQWIYFGKICLK